MTITRTWSSFLEVILNTLLLILTYQFWLTVLKANAEIDLAACLERIVLFSESHSKDSVEQKDPDEVHGTRLEFQKKSNRQASVDRRRMSRVSMRLNFPTLTLCIYTNFGRLRRHSFPCLFSSLSTLCYNTRWHNYIFPHYITYLFVFELLHSPNNFLCSNSYLVLHNSYSSLVWFRTFSYPYITFSICICPTAMSFPT